MHCALTLVFLLVQEQKAKLQRRLEQLGMQQIRLEQHIAVAVQATSHSLLLPACRSHMPLLKTSDTPRNCMRSAY